MSARISEAQAFDDLCAIIDPDNKWWWSFQGIIYFTDLSRLAAGRKPKTLKLSRDILVTGDELRYWLAVYRGLRAMFPAPKRILGHARDVGGLRAHPARKAKG